MINILIQTLLISPSSLCLSSSVYPYQKIPAVIANSSVFTNFLFAHIISSYCLKQAVDLSLSLHSIPTKPLKISPSLVPVLFSLPGFQIPRV